MTMHKDLYNNDNVDSLYVSRKKEGRGLISIEDCVDDYIEKRGEKLITATRNDTNNTRIDRTEMTRKQK